MLSLHGRAALRDTTVPDSTWHGVSQRGASEAWLPEPLAQRKPATPQQKPTLRLPATPGEYPLGTRTYPTPRFLPLCGPPTFS
ncbi:MAG: hypothetical protein WA045_00900, partial [Nitrospira sp.]